MSQKSLAFIFIFLSCLSRLDAQNLQPHKNLDRTNIRHVYDLKAPIALDYRLAGGNEEITIFLKVTERLRPEEDMQLTYELRPGYEAPQIVASGIIGQDARIGNEENISFYRFSMPVRENGNFLFIFVSKSFNGRQAEFRFDIPLNDDLSFPVSDILPMRSGEDIPIFNKYIEKGRIFRLVSVYSQQSEAFVYRYGHEFAPNPPPMASENADVQQSLQIDSIFSVPLNQPFQLNKQGLYFTQLDTTSLSGTSLRIEGPYYPRFVTAEGLIDPLRYISTSDEMNKLQGAEEAKLALDRYWIKVTRSRQKAKDVIRSYYRQVTAANRLFTSYKEGWKTGQGMVYLLYGPPDRVYRNQQGETWEYTGGSNLVDLSFNFVRVRNIFTNRHYNLLRDEDYRRFWFRNIDLWRKGIKQI
jgi:GWxTD domain-containing protein